MKIRQPYRLAVKFIHIRRLDYFIVVTAQVAITLVIGDNQNHTWFSLFSKSFFSLTIASGQY
jgi:hypothetical protein